MTTKSITIRNVPEAVHRQWRIRAARNGRSLEAELRAMLAALARPRRAATAGQGPASEPTLESVAEPAPVPNPMALTDADRAIQRVRDILGPVEPR